MYENSDSPVLKSRLNSKRSNIIFALRLVFGIGLVGVLVWKANISTLLSTLVGVDSFWLFMSFVVQIIGKFIWTARWSVLLNIFDIKVPFRRLLSGLMVGLFFNNFLPTSMGGDFYRGYWILNNKKLYRKSLFVIFIERMMGFITLGYVALPTIPFIILLGSDMGDLRYWLMILMLALCSGAFLLNPTVFQFFNVLFYRLGLNIFKSEREKILHSLMSLRKTSIQKNVVYVLSFLTQIIGIAFVYCVGRGLGLQLELWHYFVIVPFQVLATLLPISINGLGVREWILVLLTSALSSSVTSAQAVSLGLLLAFVGLTVSLIGGGFYVAGNRQATIPA